MLIWSIHLLISFWNSSPDALLLVQCCTGPAVSPTSFSSPAIHGNRDGMPVAASPKISQTSLSNYSHAKGIIFSCGKCLYKVVEWIDAQWTQLFINLLQYLCAVPAVSPSSLTSPAVSWNRHSVPVPAPQMESSSHLSPTNYSQPKGNFLLGRSWRENIMISSMTFSLSFFWWNKGIASC